MGVDETGKNSSTNCDADCKLLKSQVWLSPAEPSEIPDNEATLYRMVSPTDGISDWLMVT